MTGARQGDDERMRAILAPEHLGVLARLAPATTLVAFDFDGTLAPIVRERDAARMRPETAALLERVAARWPVAIVSGRARADVAARLGDAAVVAVIGNHGLEDGAAAATADELAPVRAALASLDGLAGIELEDKGRSLALHYRAAPDRPAARRAIMRALASLPAARIVTGKLLVNVLPARGPDKGEAVARLAERMHLGQVLYLGDDVTDESVFRRALSEPGWIGVRVGRSARSAARWYLREQRAVDRLLALLADPASPRPA